MKKIIFVIILVCSLCPAIAFSAATSDSDNDLVDHLTANQKLSNGVEGTYSVDGTQTNYFISTGHKQGSKVYASGNFVAEIYYKDLTAAYASGDLLAGSAFDSTDFDNLTAVGEKP